MCVLIFNSSEHLTLLFITMYEAEFSTGFGWHLLKTHCDIYVSS